MNVSRRGVHHAPPISSIVGYAASLAESLQPAVENSPRMGMPPGGKMYRQRLQLLVVQELRELRAAFSYLGHDGLVYSIEPTSTH
jgi:hypothetical protein